MGAVAILVFTAMLVSMALAVDGFPDVSPGHPYYAAIHDLAGRGIINGYETGDFGPGDPVRRQQFAKMIVGSLGLEVVEEDWQDAAKPFVDLGPDDLSDLYPHEFVAVCAREEITKGTADPTRFAPYDYISRYQVITMVVRAADSLYPGALGGIAAEFTGTGGWGSDSTHGANAVKAEYNGLLAGLDLSLSPYGDMSRGEVAQVLHNLLVKLAPGAGATTTAGAEGGNGSPLTRDDPSGVVAGLVFEEPVALAEALALGPEWGGEPIAVYRTDSVLVGAINTGAPSLPGMEPELVPSRFAYVDAEQIPERRMAAEREGLAPPTEGLHISQSYWNHWQQEWLLAEKPGVLFEAVALYVRGETLNLLAEDERFRVVVIIPHRRSDSISDDYLGELFLWSDGFPGGILTEPAPPADSPASGG